MVKRWYAGALLLVLSRAVPAVAAEPDASTRAAARNIATAGVQALQQGDLETATQKLSKAFELLPAPSIALWLARALVKRGQLVEGAEHYLQAGRLMPSQGNEQAVQEQAQRDAAQELEELTPRIPKLVVTLEGAQASEVSLSIDGKPFSAALLGEEQPLNPGAHGVKGTRASEVVDQALTLSEGQKQAVVLRFAPRAPAAAALPPAAAAATPPAAAPGVTTPVAPTTAPGAAAPVGVSLAPQGAADRPGASGNKTLAYVALAVGGAGLVTGSITGGIAMSKRSSLDANTACRDGKCSSSIQSEIDSFRTMRTVSTIGFIAGGVCAGAGVVLLLTSGSSTQKAGHPTTRIGLQLAPTSVGVAGSF